MMFIGPLQVYSLQVGKSGNISSLMARLKVFLDKKEIAAVEIPTLGPTRPV